MKRKIRNRLLIALSAAVFLLFGAFFFVYAVTHGIILLNHPSKEQYPVRGVDVSHYQGEIDWPVLSGQNISFAYIKATEGSSHTDEKFLQNWEAAGRTDLKIGAYHFFSFDSGAVTQLEHFIHTVPAFQGMLPPVIDVEFYGDKKQNPPDQEAVAEQLQIMLDGLEAHYHMTPVLYSTEDVYGLYLKDRFDRYPLWIRNVVKRPETGGHDWMFWQYANRGRLRGYEGEETYIDLNVFNGNADEWKFWSESFEKGYRYRLNWGSFGMEEQKSSDGAYTAALGYDGGSESRADAASIIITDVSSGEVVDTVFTDRILDFWGFCWEENSYRLWTQSGDMGMRCFEYQEGMGWNVVPDAVRPASVISKYDSYENKE